MKLITVTILTDGDYQLCSSWCPPKHRVKRPKKSPFKRMSEDPVKWFAKLMKEMGDMENP